MPGKEPEELLGEPELGALLGDQHVEREQRLETATERIALREPDGDEVAVERRPVAVKDPHAGLAVLEQRLTVARLDALREVVEIAAEAEHFGVP